MTYQEFLERKRHSVGNFGFEPNFIPDIAFDFQKMIIEKSVRKGRMANFADTGLGKTLIQLAIAKNVVNHTNGNVLILTPLAVAFQFILEAEKIGVDDIEYSKDGKYTKKIVVCNYERLHYFNESDFKTVILDECFAPDTKIQVVRNNSLREIYIKDCLIGDKVLNCTGLDTIKAVKFKEVSYAIKLRFNGKEIISSPRHPYFTQRGWVAAKEIRRGDAIASTDKAMRILRGEFSDSCEGAIKNEILREILFSEMEDEATSIFSECSQSDSSGKTGQEYFGMAENSKRSNSSRKNKDVEPNEQSRNEEKMLGIIESDGSQTFSAWGQWSGNDITTAINEGCVVRELGGGICHISGKATKGLPDELQNRFSELSNENCDRDRWEQPLQPKRNGFKEGYETGFFRVESFEVLESGHIELDKYRDETGTLYFVDLEIERHPSFTINEGLVHNSSILKCYEGATRNKITSFVKKIPYRFLATATPSPNDYIELGTSSEALGYLGYTDMLTKFFKNNNNTVKASGRALANAGSDWYLKPHAETDFWRWVSQWAISIRKPSDLGFSDERYILPQLHEVPHIVRNENPLAINGQGSLFAFPAINFFEIKAETRTTLIQRCEKAVELSNPHDTSVHWVNLNDEAKYIREIDKNVVEVSGKMDIDQKEEILLAFSKGEIKKLLTKTSITAFGLNWQHCNHTTYFPTYSYEQYYQAIRRFYRFGQKRDVYVDLVLSDGQTKIMESLQIKKDKANDMFTKLSENVNSIYEVQKKEFTKNICLPNFL